MENLESQVTTREERNKTKKRQLLPIKRAKHDDEKPEVEGAKEKRPKKLRVRLFPIWLRLIIVTVLVVVCFFIGAMVGYGVIGDGSPADVFKKSTWTHITDIINEGTDTQSGS